MRRSIFVFAIVLLFLAACFYRPVIVEPSIAPRLGTSGRSACREIGRTRCASEACRGSNMDYVTVQCLGAAPMHRCVVNFRCTGN
jgi:hypothetical protein